MNKLCKVAVIGAGAFGTGMAEVAASSGRNMVKIWAREKEIVDSINQTHKHASLFTNHILHENVSASTDIEEALHDANIVISCLPTQVTPSVLQDVKNIFPLSAPFVCCSKGMLIETEKFLSEEVNDIFGKNALRYCILSGPSFAEQMLEKHPTLVVIASKDQEAAKFAQHQLSYRYFRVYTQDDVAGVEVAGALKNILAIGAGIIEGNGFGINTTAAFIARGTKEIYKFAKLYNANSHTLFGLAGIGDIILTGFGEQSRNRSFGYRLGRGETIEDILKTSAGVVEGVSTLAVVARVAKKNNLDMPIITAIDHIVNEKGSVEDALSYLMLRKLESEFAED